MALTNGTNLELLINGSPGEEHYNKLMQQWRGFDALIQCVVKDKDLATPPASPSDGDVYIVGPSSIGAWAGKDGKIARFSLTIASWEFFSPKKGWCAYVQDENTPYYFSGTTWIISNTTTSIVHSPTNPINPQIGDFWLDTSQDPPVLSIYLNDGVESTWFSISGGGAGSQGDTGWSPNFSLETLGDLILLKVSDWVGGTGVKPPVNLYVGSDGLSSNFELAQDIRGLPGEPGSNVWDDITDKPAVIAAGPDVLAARTVINLENVNNTSDANKPVSTATQTALDLKANIASPALTGTTTVQGIKETVITGNTGLAYSINAVNGSIQNLTLTGNCVFTFPTPTAGTQFTLFLKQDAVGGRTVTWPANVRWPANLAPTITSTASRTDVMAFIADGTYWLGFVGGLNFNRS